MTSVPNRSRLTSALLAALNILLLLVIVLEWQTGPGRSASEIPVPAVTPATIPSGPVRTLTLDRYTEIVSRPLFWSERRPLAQTDAPTAQVVAAPFAFLLIGVVKSPAGNRALVGRPGAADIVSVRVGDVVEGWRIEEIRDESVVFSQGARREQVSLAE